MPNNCEYLSVGGVYFIEFDVGALIKKISKFAEMNNNPEYQARSCFPLSNQLLQNK